MSDATTLMNRLLRRLAGDGATGETAPPPAPEPEPPADPEPPRFAAGDANGGRRGTTAPPDASAIMNRWLRGESA